MNYDNITKENFNNYYDRFWNMLFQIDMFLFENNELEDNEHFNYTQLECMYLCPKGTDFNNSAFDILSNYNLSVPDRFKKVFDEADLVFKYLLKFSHDNNIFFQFCSSKVYENTFEDRFKDYENKFIDVERVDFIKSELKTVLNSTIFRFNLFSIENQTIIKNTKVKKTEFLQSISKDFNLQIIENDDLDLLNRNKYRVEIDKELIKSNPTNTTVSNSDTAHTEKYLGQPTNEKANEFFDFLIEHYRPEDKTQIKYVNILHYLKNDAEKKHFTFKVKQSEYKILVNEKTGIDIKKFQKSERYTEEEKPIFHKLENTFLKNKTV